jgi:hypothetical protein
MILFQNQADFNQTVACIIFLPGFTLVHFIDKEKKTKQNLAQNRDFS